MLIGALVVAALFPTLIAAGRGRLNPFHLLTAFPVIYAFFFAGKAAVLLSTDEYSIPLLNEGLFLAILGLFAFYAGYWLYVGRRTAWREPAYRPGRSDFRRLHLFVIGLIATGLLCCLSLVAEAGGLAEYAVQLAIRGAAQESKGYQIAGMKIAAVGAVLYYCVLRTGRPRPSRAWFCVYVAAAAICEILIGARANTAALIAALLAIGFYTGVRVRWSLLVPAGIIIAALFVIVPDFRIGASPSVDSLDKDVDRFMRMDVTALDPLLDILQQVPRNVPFQSGRGFYDLAIYPIPRALWAEKPQVLGASGYYTAMFHPEYFGTGSSYGSSILGELYLNFGLSGIVIGMVVYGALAGFFQSQSARGPAGVAIAASSVYPFIFGIRGGYWAFLPELTLCEVPLLLGLAFISGRECRESLSQPI
jgi:oligosaccharide repeat unit polymerase